MCVCMRWQVTDANGTAQAKLSDLQNTLMRAGNSISAQNTIISLQLQHFSHWFWALGQGVLTFYNTHVCVH